MITLEQRTLIAAPIERCFDLARSVEVHLVGNRHWGEQAIAKGGLTSGLLGLGDVVIWQARHFGVRQQLTSKITAFDRPSYFQDTMLSGAFRFMQHDHHFRTEADGRTEMLDIFVFAAPFGPFGRIVEVAILKSYMQSLLRERNAVIREIAESDNWKRYLPYSSSPSSL